MYNKHRKVFNLLAVRELQTESLTRYWFSAFNSAKMEKFESYCLSGARGSKNRCSHILVLSI